MGPGMPIFTHTKYLGFKKISPLIVVILALELLICCAAQADILSFVLEKKSEAIWCLKRTEMNSLQ